MPRSLLVTLLISVAPLVAQPPAVILSDPKPEALPPPPPVEPNPTRVSVPVGQLAKLTATPADQSEADWEGWAFAWQMPDGLSWQIDSNRREAYVTSGTAGEYRVLVVMARNGEPRPHVCRAEIVVVVTGPKSESTPKTEPSPPNPSDDVAEARARFPNLIAGVRAVSRTADADTRRAMVEAYTAVAAAIHSGTATTADAVQRELNARLGVPALGTTAGQTLALAIADVVNVRVKNAEQLGLAEQRLMFLAVADALK